MGKADRTRRVPFVRVWSVAAAALGMAGCAHEGPALLDVTGTVTFNGRPARAEVVFEPEHIPGKSGGRASSAWTDSDGTFRLDFTAERHGAVPGKHRVLIRVLHPTKPGAAKTFDEAAGALKTCRLERTVSREKAHFDFPLRW